MRPRVTTASASDIADELIRQAVAAGFPLTSYETAAAPLGGGNTAEVVSHLTLHAPFVFKLDRTNEKLAAEGRVMRGIRAGDLPDRFKNAWPVVYAIREEPPYAYLMEFFPTAEGWRSLENHLYPTDAALPVIEADAVRALHAVLDVLFEGYTASRDTRSLPNVGEDYVERMRSRLQEAAALDGRFRSQPLSINGTPFEPWQSYLDLIGADWTSAIAAPFSTVAHGDPNPGNLLTRAGASSIQVKLIDPKEWGRGDYLFDVAKLTHFFDATGPIEKPAAGRRLNVRCVDTGIATELVYTFDVPTWTRALVDACLRRVEEFAVAYGDVQWRARYELGMAANLLGLPAGRLKKGRSDAALALYGEGMRWLAQVCGRFRGGLSTVTPRTVAVDRSQIEPEPLARVRAVVRRHAPELREAEDRRGFQLLHWRPVRENSQGKPVELSLEHEARLKPASEGGLERLQRALTVDRETVVRDTLLPHDATFGSLIVRPIVREPGLQSVDRYYDLEGAPQNARLIPRMLSLRERVRTSDFMSWTSSGEARALNLELPFVALEQTGVIVRLEFNWIDELKRTVAEFRTASDADAEPTSNPLWLASQGIPIARSDVEPVLEHTTFREKYSLASPTNPGEPELELFHLNIDHVVAKSLRTGRIATYSDVDIAPAKRVDAAGLAALIALTRAIADRFELVPVGATKAWRDALVTGELDP